MIVFVGMNPGRDRGKPSSALQRLSTWADELQLGPFYSFTNVWPLPGSFRERDVDLEFLRHSLGGHEKVVALGGTSSRVLSRAGVEHFPMPHPSGLNRQLNDHAYVERKLDELRAYVEGRHPHAGR